MIEENTNMNKEVKKKKNPKRVERGKKLAEWNRKYNKKTKLEPPLVEELAQNVLAYKYWILDGALAIIGVLCYTNRESVQELLPKEIQRVPDSPIPPQQVQVQELLPKQIQKVPDPPSPPTSDLFVMD